MDLKPFIRDIQDWPQKGIVFRDITPLLKDKRAFGYSIEMMYDKFKESAVDIIVSPESRGFIFGSALSVKMKTGFVPVRKKGKLPWKKLSQEYNLEYGKDTVEMHKDAIRKGDKVLIVDDLLATGGTISAVRELVEKSGGQIKGFCFLIELTDLKGRERLQGYDVFSLLKY